MKKILTLTFIICCLLSKAQEPLVLQPIVKDTLAAKKDTSWKFSGFFGVNFSNTTLSNWQGGGQNNLAGNAILNLQADYKKGKHEWVNKLDAQYGLVRQGSVGTPVRKNIDQLFALSKYNLNAFSKYWFYAVQADYRTQFAPGYKYDGDSTVGRATSDFNSPGYIQLALGLDYKPTNYFSVTIAPAAGKITMVNRQYLADEGAYGVDKAEYDADGNLISHGKKVRYEFGGRVILRFKKDIVKNINLDSYLDLFSNYAHNPQNIDVVFNNLITFRINKYFTANIISQVLYDDDVNIKYDWHRDGQINEPEDFNGPRVQMLTTLSIGFGYKF